ncbi:hypothetical protein JCM18899A_05440 [Nocardioides sp. AN3]
MPESPQQPPACPDCGHLVYRPLMVPVRKTQQSCRAFVAGQDGEVVRCGCQNVVHRLPTMRPRHRLDPVG